MSDSASNTLFWIVSLVTLVWFLNERTGPQNIDPAPRLLAPGVTQNAVPLNHVPQFARTGEAYYDSQVRPASGVTPALLTAQSAVGSNGAITVNVEQTVPLPVAPKVLKWKITQGSESVLLVKGDSFTVRVSGDTVSAYDINLSEKSDTDFNTDNSDRVAVVTDLTTGEQTYTLVVTSGTSTLLTQSIKVIPPLEDNQQIGEPEIVAATNNAFKTPTSPLPADNPIRAYEGYLKISGASGFPQNTDVTFAVFDKDTGEFLNFANGSAVVDQGGRWESDLVMRLPGYMNSATQAEGFVLALAKADNNHRYSNSSKPLYFAVGSAEQPLAMTADLVIHKDDTGQTTAPTLADGTFVVKTTKFKVSGGITEGSTNPSGSEFTNLLADSHVVLYRDDSKQPLADVTAANTGAWDSTVDVGTPDQTYDIKARTVLGKNLFGETKTVKVRVQHAAPRVMSIEAKDARLSEVKVTFSEPVQLGTDADMTKAFILVNKERDTTVIPYTATPAPTFDDQDNSITLSYADVPPGVYLFTVQKGLIVNKVGTALKDDEVRELYRSIEEDIGPSRGIGGPTGPYVEFSEYTEPRPFINGFNPSDRVETRVSRLYYFRDAHRVAQIVNRKAKSYNRAAVEMKEQIANKSRQIADQATDDRRLREQRAVEAARKTREAESQLQQAQQTANLAAREAVKAGQDEQRSKSQLATAQNAQNGESGAGDSDTQQIQQQIDAASSARKSLDAAAVNAQQRAEVAYAKVQELREKEAQASEDVQKSTAKEDRAREEQFRREVAAAHEDPDTYAPGNPDSKDPVRQVSISVIGEGLIQLRGPIKGINIIRTMINQIDAPVGQVRVSVHTVQINGEKGDRMEKVATRIQRYIDHSRFLTLQSAEMLRKSIVKVAAQKAMEFGGAAGMSQAERDQKYLFGFFGEDFIHELEAIDSEFLKTGNKLLSIHSMDSTSLASALFLMALAKNSTRMQILQEFEQMMSCELPQSEQEYFDAGYTNKCRRHFIGRVQEKYERKGFPFLSENARFRSIRGMFDADLQDDFTMTPIQREFVRLAQIFKSRLIVEMELKQRVMERAVIEERLGNRQEDLERARDAERAANKALAEVGEQLAVAQEKITVRGAEIRAELKQKTDKFADIVKRLELFGEMAKQIQDKKVEEFEDSEEPYSDQFRFSSKNGSVVIWFRYSRKRNEDPYVVPFRLDDKPQSRELAEETATQLFKSAVDAFEDIAKALDEYNFDSKRELGDIKGRIPRLKKAIAKDAPYFYVKDLLEAACIYRRLTSMRDQVESKFTEFINEGDEILTALSGEDADFRKIYRDYVNLREQVVRIHAEEAARAEKAAKFNTVNEQFLRILPLDQKQKRAERIALEVRRPLDHKKFLDMLVDEMEDKFIELLEGTRAHTANIDAYIKRVITSLDDDFNTQFYYPTFRYVRDASRAWDVQMGQVETTNVLANNRGFAKVKPEATMEFDLPKRDIMIVEAMNGAKAAIDDFGALAQDPTFLSLAKLGSGSPTSTLTGGAGGGSSPERNVLSGLSTDTQENLLAQHGPGGTQFGAALENLIPDPAIYKFETGTGWEIRPIIQPDGQALVFHFNYMYTTNIREPVRADEKHLGRVKRHFVDTDVQLSNFELREISRYTVGLKASRTSRGVPLLEDIPGIGLLFRPLPSDESSLQQNLIMGQATIFPTLFDLMGLRWAPVVADLDPLRLSSEEFTVRNRRRVLMNRVFDKSSSEVDKFLRIPEAERRMDLYRSQETIPTIHPNGYQGPGANLIDSHLQEGYSPTQRPQTEFVPGASNEGSRYVPGQIQERLKLNPPGSQGSYRSSGTESRSFSVPAPRNVQPPARSAEPTPEYQGGSQPTQAPGFFDRSMQSQRSLRRLPATTPVQTASAQISRLPGGGVPTNQSQPAQHQSPVQQASYLQGAVRPSAPAQAAPAQSTQWPRVHAQPAPQ